MNENENNLTELQKDLEPKVNMEVQTAEVSNSEPEPVSNPEPVVTPQATASTTPPKKNNKMLIIVIIVVLLLGVGAWYVCTQTDLLGQNTKEESKKSDKKKDNEKDKEEEQKDDDEPVERMDNGELQKYSGVYSNGEYIVKLYPLENETVFYSIDDFTRGFAVGKNGVLIDDSFGETVSFTIDGNNFKVEASEYPDYEGTYTKDSDYSKEDLINDIYSKDGLYESAFNGHYTLKEDDMYMFQSDEDTVRVIILAKSSFSSFDVEFDIIDDKTIKTDFFDDYFTITINSDNVVFSTEGEDHSHDGTYKKDGTVDFDELLEYGLY